jgi:hypothetical protein
MRKIKYSEIRCAGNSNYVPPPELVRSCMRLIHKPPLGRHGIYEHRRHVGWVWLRDIEKHDYNVIPELDMS